MLRDDAILRRLPRALDKGQRLLLEALLTSADLVDLSFDRLVEELTVLSIPPAAPVPIAQRTSLALHSWAIIDNLHVFATFARRLRQGDEKAPDWLKGNLSAATRLRNKMDHRDNNLGNLTRARLSLPIFGVVAFYTPPDENRRFRAHQIPLGAFNSETLAMPFVDRAARPEPDRIGDVSLTAFDERLDLSAAVEAVDAAVTALNLQLEDQLPKDVAAAAVDSKSSIEELMQWLDSPRLVLELTALTDEEARALFGPDARPLKAD